jgi:phage shock protein A
MLDQVRKGKRSFSDAIIYRILDAEREAGLIEPEEEKPVPQERPPPAKPPPDIAATCAASFQSLENELHQLSNDWKNERESFQRLEKNVTQFSNHWKKFQSLETGVNTLEERMTRLESISPTGSSNSTRETAPS